MTHTTRNIAIVCAAALFALVGSQHASAITVAWGPSTAINSNDDIINPANVIEAVNFANSGQPAVVNVNVGGNIIPFNRSLAGPAEFHSDSFFDDNNPASGSVTGNTSSDFHQVLDGFADNGTFGYTFSGLTPGETYFVQAFHSDDRGSNDVDVTISGQTVTLLNNAAQFESSFAIATVTLDGGENSITVSAATGGGGPINAYVLSQAAPPVPAPEPSSLILAGMALAGLATFRRRRRS